METIKLRETDEFIKLGQALKAAGLVESGEVDTRRGRKLYPGDTASFNGQEIKIEK